VNSAKDYKLFVGIDWATGSHEVAVLDGERSDLGGFRVEHTGKGVSDLIDRLTKLSGGDPSLTAIGIGWQT
jgi:hypothetical protein